MSDNTITITGNVAADPELRFTQDGKPVANFPLISHSRRQNKATGEWEDGPGLTLRVTAWGRLADNAAESIQKGARVTVTGALATETYRRPDGSGGLSVCLTADDVAVSLRRATATITRNQPPQQAMPQQQGTANTWGNTGHTPQPPQQQQHTQGGGYTTPGGGQPGDPWTNSYQDTAPF